MCWRGWVRVDVPVGQLLFQNSLLCSAVEEDCTGGLVTEMSYDSDKVCADIVLHGCLQSCVTNSVEGLLVDYELNGSLQSCTSNPVEGLLEVWRHGIGFAGAGDVSHRGFLGWGSAQLMLLPALKPAFIHDSHRKKLVLCTLVLTLQRVKLLWTPWLLIYWVRFGPAIIIVVEWALNTGMNRLLFFFQKPHTLVKRAS